MKLLRTILLIVFMVSSSAALYAQGEEPEPLPAKCTCNPMVESDSYGYGCATVAAAACSTRNFNFESTHYFEHWKANFGVACNSKINIKDRYDIGSYNMKDHVLIGLMDNTTEATDPHCGVSTRPPADGGNQSVRLGDYISSARAQSLVTSVVVEKTNPYLTLMCAIILQDGGHEPEEQPFFLINIVKTGTCDTVIRYKVIASANIPGFQTNGSFHYKDWTNYSFDLSAHIGGVPSEDFTITITTADCGYCGHMGYAFIDGMCGKKTDKPKPDPDPDPEDPDPVDPENPFNGVIKCLGANVMFSSGKDVAPDETYLWDFGDGKGWSTDKEPAYYYSAPGIYTAKQRVTSAEYGITLYYETLVKIIDCCALEDAQKIQQENCITAFSPVEGETYILHAWVKEDITTLGSDQRIHTYKRDGVPHIRLNFFNGTPESPTDDQWIDCYPSGPVIDGWQRIEKEFVVPTCPAERLNFALILKGLASIGDESTYFDDIRIFPRKGGMKSFVYDPVSQKLVAELDEENFATFYEYDQEGALIRVKKETERGIKTIKEAGNNTSKRPK